MRKILKKALLITTIVVMVNPLYAQENRVHTQDELHIKAKHEYTHSCAAKIELSKKDIQRAARKRLWMLTQKKKIAASWLNIPILSSDKQKFTHNVEWVIIFQDLNVKEKKKQNIYIFVDLYGHVMGSNYTGK
jgi:hypothetical protein